MRTIRSGPLAAVGALVALLTLPSLSFGSLRRLDGLGKWRDGEPTEIDCSASSHDYEYYIERCIDSVTQWWINGRCIGGKKEEVSELHRCMKPDGSRPFCHDCGDGRGNVKNVCGSDNDDEDEVCGIAWSGRAEDCGDQGLTVYAHQCVARSGGSGHWYLREDYWCDLREVYLNGPNMEVVPPRTEFACGESWYYPFEEGDANVAKIDPAVPFEDAAHPFANSPNRYCLDCGMAIQVCHAGEADTTCEDLGLAPKGVDSCVLCGTPGAGAAPVDGDEGYEEEDAATFEVPAVATSDSKDAPDEGEDDVDESYEEEPAVAFEVPAVATSDSKDAPKEDEDDGDESYAEEDTTAFEVPVVATSDSKDGPDEGKDDVDESYEEEDAAAFEVPAVATSNSHDAPKEGEDADASAQIDEAPSETKSEVGYSAGGYSAYGEASSEDDPAPAVVTALTGSGTSGGTSSSDGPPGSSGPTGGGRGGDPVPGDAGVDPLEVAFSASRSIRPWGAAIAVLVATVGGTRAAFM